MTLKILTIVLSIALYVLLLSLMRHRVTFFRNYVLFPLTAIMGFGAYFVGYYSLGTYDVLTNIILGFFSTVEMVTMKSDIGGIADCCKQSTLYMVFFKTAHAMAILLAITTLLSIWGKQLTTKVLLLIQRHKRSYIFFDTNNEAMTLAENLLKKDRRRLVIFVSEQQEQMEQIEKLGAYYINPAKSRNKIGSSSLFTNIISSNSELFYISSDEARNMSGALTMLAMLKGLSAKKLRIAEEGIDMHIRIGSEDMQQVFEEARKEQGVKLNFSIFSEAEIIATQFIREYPPVNYIKPDTQKAAATTDYEVMIIGFGKRGRAILRKTIEFGQFIGSTYRATVVDMSIKQKAGSFNATYPALSSQYNIELIEDYASSDNFFNLLRERSTTLKQIVVALPSDAQNIKRAMEIHKLLSSLGRNDIDIIAVMRSTDSYNYIHTSKDFAAIHCIGRAKEVYTEAIIVNDDLSLKAIATHNYYNAKAAPAKQEEWRALSSFKQQSNISVSEHIPTKLALMGLTTERLQQFATKEKYLKFLKDNKDRYDNMARTEHLRWNAFHFARGWRRWELSEENGAGKSTGDENQKLHICLVDWDSLDAVDAHQGKKIGTFRGYDYDNSDNIWESIKKGN